MTQTIDSNVTGARIAEEATPGVLPGTPVWEPMEPNSYNDFGGQLTTKARTPINPTRQRKKGTPVDLDASGGFNQDFTETGLLKLMQGFLFADAHIPADTMPIDGSAAVVITDAANADSSYNAGAGLDIFATDDLVMVTGFANAANNGLKNVASAVAGKITVDETVTDEGTAPASARIQKVGMQIADLVVNVNGSQITLTSSATDFTTLGIVEGSWLFIGSDANAFVNANNQCFVRVDTITANTMILGKSTKQMVAEGPEIVDVMLPVFIRNEPDPNLIKRRTYQIERTLGNDGNGVMAEYLVNSLANELTLNIPTADLLNADLAFVSGDNEQRTGTEGPKSGTRPSLSTEDAFNTSSDISRFRLAVIEAGNPFPDALFGYATEGTITVNNNVTPNKAVGVLGAFAMTAGTFEVGGNLTAYFARMEAVQAVRNNADVTLDAIAVKNNGGWVFDIPLLALGDGRANVEANQPITIPLETSAAESEQGHTLMVARFPYLPDIA